MKIINLLNAKEPLTKLLECKYTSFKVVRELANLRKTLESEVEFYISQEKKLVEEYASKDEKGHPIVLEGGRIKIDSIENKEKFDKEIYELRCLEIDSITPVTLKETDFRTTDDIPSPNDLIALEGIVNFE